jgi:RHH-type proline utilization regulon transcriptional repressor/proline dehydrogenase/delta 1-pyrroline-5-carboxylate dehydrogenase
MSGSDWAQATTQAAVQNALDGAVVSDTALSEQLLPGPTGESNRLSDFARAPLLCTGRHLSIPNPPLVLSGAETTPHRL